MIEIEHAVRGKYRRVVERHSRRPGGPRSRGDDDEVGGDQLGLVLAHDLQQLGTFKVRRAPDQLDAVAVERITDDLQLVADHLLADDDQIADRDMPLHAVAAAEEASAVGTGQVQDRFAKGLGGDRPRVHRRAIDDVSLFDDDDPLAQLRRLDGGLLPGRPGPDDGQIEVLHVHFSSCPTGAWIGCAGRVVSPSSTASTIRIKRIRPITGIRRQGVRGRID